MKIPPQSKIVIGWDVRGWMSNEQAVAVLALSGNIIEWLGYCERFKFPRFEPLSLYSLLTPAFDSYLLPSVLQCTEIVIAIDAPLAFSSGFCALVNREFQPTTPPKSEIENPLAYRACERWVQDQFNKKPLSASFDKLGNNASLAISLARSLKQEGFSLVPQEGTPSSRSIIEVYPGLTKIGMARKHPTIPPLAQEIPAGLKPDTDIYDAAICALLGAIFLGWGRELGIPDLVQPIDGIDRAEGWIYCLPSDYTRSFSMRRAE